MSLAVHNLLNPTSIAVVGATDRPGNVWASGLIENLTRWGYEGQVHLVNPRRTEVAGRPCYASLSDIPDEVDHALIVVPARFVPAVLEETGRIGVHSTTIISAGFAESGPEGAQLSAEVGRISAEHQIAVVGPNCYGWSNFTSAALLTRNTIEPPVLGGHISLSFQSGNLLQLAYGLATARGLSLRYAVSSGNELVTTVNDYLEYFIEDPETTVIGLSIERIPDPERFAALAVAARAAGKPVIVLKLGGSKIGPSLALAHTASHAGRPEVVDALLADLAVIRVSSVEEMVETATLLVKSPGLPGPRVFLLSGSGGSGGLLSQLVEGTALRLPAPSPTLTDSIAELTGVPSASAVNPFDLNGNPGVGMVFTSAPGIVELVRRSEEYDVVLMGGEEPHAEELQGPLWREFMKIFVETCADASGSTFTAQIWAAAARDAPPSSLDFVRAARAMFLHGELGVRALDNAVRYGLGEPTLWSRLPSPPRSPDQIPEGSALLKLLGLESPEFTTCSSRVELAQLLTRSAGGTLIEWPGERPEAVPQLVWGHGAVTALCEEWWQEERGPVRLGALPPVLASLSLRCVGDERLGMAVRLEGPLRPGSGQWSMLPLDRRRASDLAMARTQPLDPSTPEGLLCVDTLCSALLRVSDALAGRHTEVKEVVVAPLVILGDGSIMAGGAQLCRHPESQLVATTHLSTN